jgi:hypothetical protein
MMLFMKTHKCELITNPHQIMFFYWEMLLLARITKKKKKPLIMLSTKVKYMLVSQATRQVMWTNKQTTFINRYNGLIVDH